ncbi:translation initiation factor IF-2-like [Hemicordylus capensis]|uniref:translation initiation factor IF-2-like n=1 Tax=Hemicordylus capensis TaxID=884348 RepID=UPI0023020EF0|nr:translation initiation factor IF-2-like [Hemicordylus capensis]
MLPGPLLPQSPTHLGSFDSCPSCGPCSPACRKAAPEAPGCLGRIPLGGGKRGSEGSSCGHRQKSQRLLAPGMRDPGQAAHGQWVSGGRPLGQRGSLGGKQDSGGGGGREKEGAALDAGAGMQPGGGGAHAPSDGVCLGPVSGGGLATGPFALAPTRPWGLTCSKRMDSWALGRAWETAPCRKGHAIPAHKGESPPSLHKAGRPTVSQRGHFGNPPPSCLNRLLGLLKPRVLLLPSGATENSLLGGTGSVWPSLQRREKGPRQQTENQLSPPPKGLHPGSLLFCDCLAGFCSRLGPSWASLQRDAELAARLSTAPQRPACSTRGEGGYSGVCGPRGGPTR